MAAIKALLSGGAHFLGGGVKGKSYIWLALNFALFIFCNNGGARKALVSGIVGGAQ